MFITTLLPNRRDDQREYKHEAEKAEPEADYQPTSHPLLFFVALLHGLA